MRTHPRVTHTVPRYTHAGASKATYNKVVNSTSAGYKAFLAKGDEEDCTFELRIEPDFASSKIRAGIFFALICPIATKAKYLIRSAERSCSYSSRKLLDIVVFGCRLQVEICWPTFAKLTFGLQVSHLSKPGQHSKMYVTTREGI
eukprot:scpid108501/ scgid10491/ 